MKTALVVLAALLTSCAFDTQSGTGSQTGNSVVAGRVALSGKAPMAGTEVYLRPLDWTSSQTAPTNCLQTTRTDSLGDFLFRDVPPKTYRIEARRGSEAWSKTVRAAPGTQAIVPSGVLQKVGRLACEIVLNDSTRGGIVELYGLDRSFRIPEVWGGSEFKYSLDSLPIGLQTLRVWSKRTKTVIFEKPVRIVADSTSKVEYEPGEVEFHGPVEDD